jgi:GNAT superfamily N-acetyltransferase
MEVSISPITPSEIPALLELIRELAEFERLAHEVEATTESLQAAMFGKSAGAGALMARMNEELVGYAIYYFTFSSFVGRRGIWLDDLFVRPPFRRQGIGRRLIEAVARVGVEQNCGRYEWSALNWNKNALEVYRKMGARTLDDWIILRLDADGMKKLAAASATEAD